MPGKKKDRRLGRGLSALLSETEAEGELRTVSISAILPSPFQPRRNFSEESLAELAASIKSRGLLQPLLVREIAPGTYELVAGERRLRAAKMAGLSEVPVLIKHFSDEEALSVALIENLQREDLNPLEEAEGYRRLIDEFGLSQEEIARRVGKDRSTVANALRLLKLPEKVKEDLLEERLSAGHARALLALEDEGLILKARDQVLKRKLSVRETERLVNRLKEGRPQKKKALPDPDLEALGRELAELSGAKVKVEVVKGRPRFRFDFEDLQSAERFLSLLRRLSRC
ncbi:ParB/RepB/Spo0J family partition protein [Thermosulfurimonas dismutans]|uniref:Chromosome (Plasmid) partitioning protein ParB n=1 Tax=Thermosulfurimonas dismutans TaxID=999894 RepID=A0A179D798_9BACT|nr:ParB/RepB/Spo0J family partition protein [Thermosulfurimonas dismutans]OAQ21609.1 Chromosome (plasmid) partitioning protein ParB [Thermosulfurimonas dismutans]